MLKGHVFKRQIFGSQIFALFIDTFLNRRCGVCGNYGNAMKVTYSGSNVTVADGAVCIRGRFLEEDTSTTIAAGTTNSYCSLVIEIDLDKENTSSDFVQGAYKIVKGTNNYPYLTQTDIVKNNSGIYQYELARFKTTASGITDFQDRRTFLDFDSIYDQIETEYESVLQLLENEYENMKQENGVVLTSDIVKITGEVTLTKNSKGYYEGEIEEALPSNLTKNNTILLSVSTGTKEVSFAGIKHTGSLSNSNDEFQNGICEATTSIGSGYFTTNLISKGTGSSQTLLIDYEIVFLKI